MDVYASHNGLRLNRAGNSLQIGNGVQIAAIHTDFSEGGLNESGSPLHAAIQGNGFFVVRNTDGTAGYTRAGDFTVNSQGFLVSPNGGQVQGYQAEAGVIAQGTPIASLQLPIGQTLAPQITSEATFRMNLNSSSATGGQFHATMQVYDSLGASRTMDLTYTRQADGTFQMTGTLDDNPVEFSVDGGAASAGPVTFSFDSNGFPTAPSTVSIIPDQTQLDGATLPAINLNLRETNPDGSLGAFNLTSYSRPSSVSATIQNGYSAGELAGAAVDPSGNIFGIFTNGQSRIVGQYAVATFSSNDGLGRLGGNMFGETISSGQPSIGTPGAGGRGVIAGGYLEQSNVNITNEFVELIEAQRGFQANSRVISSLNQTFQDLLQII
jgi:flagellar hook protein FlgE